MKMNTKVAHSLASDDSYAEAMLDPDAEVAGFVVKRRELTTLIEHAYGYWLNLNWGYFLTGSTADYGSQVLTRLDEMREGIGDEKFQRTLDKVFEKFSQNTHSFIWDTYLHRGEYDWDSVQIAVNRCSTDRRKHLGTPAHVKWIRTMAKRDRGKRGTAT
jgi:uncharacterized protein YkuJ